MLTLESYSTEDETKSRMSWSLYMVEKKEHCMGLGIMFHLVLTIKLWIS